MRTLDVAIPDLDVAQEPTVQGMDAPAAGDASAPTQVAAEPQRGWLGIELGASQGKMPGVEIRHVFRGSPAELAGLRSGDVITKVDGNDVRQASDVQRLVASHAAGDRVSVAYRRDSRNRFMAVRLASKPGGDDIARLDFLGAPAPEFHSLMTAQGSLPATLGALRGKVVVIEFWAPWCQACHLLAPKLNEWRARLGPQGVEVVGITVAPVSAALQSASEVGMKYTIASDESGETSRSYRAFAIPALYVIDQKGIVRDVVVGYSPGRMDEAQALIEKLLSTP
jgi:peroxiredoxin